MKKIVGLWVALAGIVMALGLVVTSGIAGPGGLPDADHARSTTTPRDQTHGSNASLNAEWVQLHNTSGSPDHPDQLDTA